VRVIEPVPLEITLLDVVELALRETVIVQLSDRDPSPERVRVAVAVALPNADPVRVVVPVAETARVRVVDVVGLSDGPDRVRVVVSV